MPVDEKDPQSHASQTASDANRTKIHGDFEDADFLESHRESETNASQRRGMQQPEWTDRVDVLRPVPTVSEVDEPARKITSEKGGAKREGFFRRRDYR